MRALALIGVLGLFAFACASGDDDDDDDGTQPTDSGTPDSGDTSVCETWFVDYALMPAQFDIRGTPFGAGDATNDVGPGTVRLRFEDEGGELGEGAAELVELDLTLDFEVTMVHTEIKMEAGPDECGVADGTYDGARIAWSTPVSGFHSFGQITCNASEFVCTLADLLPVGMPLPRDSTRDQALMPFIFTSSTSTVIPPNGFIMEYVEIPNDDAGETFLRFTGRETARICVREPDCP